MSSPAPAPSLISRIVAKIIAAFHAVIVFFGLNPAPPKV